MTNAEESVRAYARAFPTPNVKRAIELCESGQLTWTSVADLFASATKSALQEVRQS